MEGITVVSLEHAVAAPFATRQLADLGARVIKIERPDGGDFARGYDSAVKGLSTYFVWLNRSKESLTLDLKRPEAGDVLARLLERADVFVQNLAPGAAERLGTDAGRLRRRLPRLIVCNVSGYGSSGPYARKKAYDMLVQSEVGLLSITGSADAPAKVAISIADIAAGMYAYSSVLAALLARARTGGGTTIEVSLFDALAEWMSQPAYQAAYTGAAPRRSGAHHATIAPYGPFRCADGRDIFFGIQNPREWTRFCADVLLQPAVADAARFSTNASRVEHRPALHAVIDGVFRTLTQEEAIDRLDRAQIAWAAMNGVAEFVRHPQLVERGRWCTIDSPAGALQALVPPAAIEGVEPVMGAVPALGAHTDAILADLGFPARIVGAWRKEGVI